MSKVTIFWFRRDLRLHDNHALFQALSGDLPVVPIFIFDQNILDELPSDDARVTFIHQEISVLKENLQRRDKDLKCFFGKPLDVFNELISDINVDSLYFNRDYEPYAKERDQLVTDLMIRNEIGVRSFKDHVIFESVEVLKSDGDPYVVFTPYKNRWLQRMSEDPDVFKHYCSEDLTHQFADLSPEPMITLEEMSFEANQMDFPPKSVAQSLIKSYHETRNIPSLEKGTSRLGVHFRFGTISIRDKALKASELNDTFLSELIWRDFYSQILDHFPRVVEESFRTKYDKIEWRNNENEFKAWTEGKTGYPLVDAGMRELNTTGFMHNRVRMLTASFLTKHLLIDWRWGESYFASKLLDYDLASNNGGWQWAAGSGTDAAPYFRIFNPSIQLKKFDKQRKYVKTYVPEYGTDDYPEPLVDHREARERCLDTYKKALN